MRATAAKQEQVETECMVCHGTIYGKRTEKYILDRKNGDIVGKMIEWRNRFGFAHFPNCSKVDYKSCAANDIGDRE